MIRSFSFKDALSLRSFIAENIPKLIGRELTGFRWQAENAKSKTPLVLSFDELSIVFEYYDLGCLTVRITDTAGIEADSTLSFLFKNTTENDMSSMCCTHRENFSLVNQKLTDIWFIVTRDASFVDILIEFEDHNVLVISAEDGYMIAYHEVIVPLPRR